MLHFTKTGAPVLADVEIQRLESATGTRMSAHRVMGSGAHVVKFDETVTAQDAYDMAEAIRDEMSDQILYVEPDEWRYPTKVPNDKYYKYWDAANNRWIKQWHYYESAGGINAEAAWDMTTGSPDVYIGVIDTGILPHADLVGRYVGGYDFISDTTVARDGDGRDSNPTDPGDCCYGGSSSWHGTHVAGTIAAASNNGQGVAGINWVSKIVPLRAMGNGGGLMSDICDAIRWAAGVSVEGIPDNPYPVKVVNLSLGAAGTCSQSEQEAIDAAVSRGTVVVVAAGNDGANAQAYSPAGCKNVITVASIDRDGNRSSFSNYGSAVEIAAPGGSGTGGVNDILSTMNTGTDGPLQDSYSFMAGTSMAAPHVTGVVSLMFSVVPTLTPAQVLQALQRSAKAFSTGSTCRSSTKSCGSGIIDASAAVQAVMRSQETDKATLDYGSITIDASVVQTVTIKNVSAAGVNLTVSSLKIAGDSPDDFLIESQNCQAASLPPQGTCTVNVKFWPTELETRTASLSIESDAINAPSTVTLTGVVLDQTKEPTATQTESGAQEAPVADEKKLCFFKLAFQDTPMERELVHVREMRDHWKSAHGGGQWIVSAYYRLSGALGPAIERSTLLRRWLRLFLTPVVKLASRSTYISKRS